MFNKQIMATAVMMAVANGKNSAGGTTTKPTDVKQPAPTTSSTPHLNQAAHPAAQATGAVGAPINYEADAGAGTEGADIDSFAIPFLLLLQPLSPQVMGDKPVPGAAANMFINSVTNELYGASAIIIPCAFQRRWLRWTPREMGGGFKGSFDAAQVADMRAKNQFKEMENRLYFPLEDGSVNPMKCDKLSDTRSHYVLVLKNAEDTAPQRMVLALSSTGIKKSKNFLARIESLKFNRTDGTSYTAPSFSHMFAITTEKKTNEKGTWFLPVIDAPAKISNAAIYAAGKAFHDQVLAGKVEVAHDSLQPDANGEEGGGDPGKF